MTRSDVEYHDASYSPRRRDLPRGVGQEPPFGAHLVTPRRGYVHHGIYVGGGQVVQYTGLARGLRAGPVEKVSLAEFSRGRSVSVQDEVSVFFDRQEVVRRALSRIGEDCYHVLTNNCEHFCEWCLRGEARSYQLEQWRPLVRWFLSFAINLGSKLESATSLGLAVNVLSSGARGVATLPSKDLATRTSRS
ncbi:MAG: lecithin retinol acyltransferase family protein [Steroidobacteraceae bacterium]